MFISCFTLRTTIISSSKQNKVLNSCCRPQYILWFGQFPCIAYASCPKYFEICATKQLSLKRYRKIFLYSRLLLSCISAFQVAELPYSLSPGNWYATDEAPSWYSIRHTCTQTHTLYALTHTMHSSRYRFHIYQTPRNSSYANILSFRITRGVLIRCSAHPIGCKNRKLSNYI